LKRLLFALYAFSSWLALTPIGLAGGTDAMVDGSNKPAPTVETEAKAGGITALPQWLKVSGEMRGRMERGTAFDSDSMAPFYMNRFRLNVAVQPVRWLRFNVEAQDARAFSLGAKHDHSEARNPFDIHRAYAEFGNGETGWLLRAGRQELAIGDERLLGADADWDCIGQAFDAVRVGYSRGRVNATGFVGFRVQPTHTGRMDRYDRTSRIAGVLVQIKAWRDGILEPYAMWKRGEDTLDLMDNPGHRDVVASGIRAQGGLPRDLDYDIEMVVEGGHVVADRMSAWAGHWALGWKPLGKDSRMRLGAEYNFASGDNNRSDGRHGTFDDMYPAGYNEFGTQDPFAWRNIRYPAAVIEVSAGKHWTFGAGYRYFSLATTHDGLYLGGDEFMVKNQEANSSYVGSQTLVSATYSRSKRWKIGAGYGYLFPGEFLRESGYQSPQKTTYLMSSFTF
jgi:hypothetical protein